MQFDNHFAVEVARLISIFNYEYLRFLAQRDAAGSWPGKSERQKERERERYRLDDGKEEEAVEKRGPVWRIKIKPAWCARLRRKFRRTHGGLVVAPIMQRGTRAKRRSGGRRQACTIRIATIQLCVQHREDAPPAFLPISVRSLHIVLSRLRLLHDVK